MEKKRKVGPSAQFLFSINLDKKKLNLQVLPASIANKIATPAMAQLVGNHINILTISCN